MKLPNADNAIIAPEKLRDYLLNPEHRRGRSKAKMLLSMGYRTDHWQQLEMDLRRQHLLADIDTSETNDYGTTYIIVAELAGPNGDDYPFRSVWQIDFGTDLPRLITMYPEW
jgi:hypothetical protein